MYDCIVDIQGYNKANCNLQFHPIAQTDVAQIIDNLKPKTSTGIDNISSKLLKQTKNSITAPLTIIINQIMATGIFPDALQISKVIPLYKRVMKQIYQTIDQ